MLSWRVRLAAMLPAILLAASAKAQWTEQSIPLQPGWNAIHLAVDPVSTAPADLFAGLPVESAWSFNRSGGGVQYLTSPSSLIPEDADWLAWFAPGSPEAPLSDLQAITGGRAYLVKLGGSSPATLTVFGQPSQRRQRYLTDSLNLVGFPVSDPGPTVAAFFEASPAHAGQPAYRLAADGNWVALNPTVDRLRDGEAIWISTAGASRYQGPFDIEAPMTEGVDFGARSVTLPFTLRSPGSTPRTLTLSLAPSLAPPASSTEVLAGEVPLTRYIFDPPNQIFGQQPVTAPFDVTVPAEGEVTLTLGVDRNALASFTPPPDTTAAYQSLLRIEDADGSVRTVAVRAQGSGERGGQRAIVARGSEVVNLRPGLWVGNVTVDAVSQPANAALSGSTDPLPAPQSFQFRLIMHVDADGDATLLQQVYLMFKPAVTAPDPGDPDATIVVDPARFVLVSDPALLPQFSGSVLRDGEDVGRRISSAAFTFGAPQAMATDTSSGRKAYEVALALGYDDPLNPFKHKYHPDHDNRNEQYDQTLPAGRESYDLSRALSLELSPTDPQDLGQAGYGDTVIAGTYRETITGVHRDPINVSGIFRLENVSTVEVLNDVP